MSSTVGSSILIAGVGGQGILRASDILSMVAMEAGYDVKKSEVHGMAQRGGCVTSHVRYGKKVFSPIAQLGDVDVLLSFEKLETLRYLNYLKKNGVIIINDDELYPPSVNMGKDHYPIDILDITKQNFERVSIADGKDLAAKAGNVRTINTALLGILSSYLDLKLSIWIDVIKKVFPDKLVQVNLDAFKLGRSL
ncbi:MAG: indolepyruvate oxidoreductase subunit beta [Syntrophaceae bacterium]|nr:indolepyruvate oxidoreductase subunit beta [Syntrophaceae bacterium]